MWIPIWFFFAKMPIKEEAMRVLAGHPHEKDSFPARSQQTFIDNPATKNLYIYGKEINSIDAASYYQFFRLWFSYFTLWCVLELILFYLVVSKIDLQIFILKWEQTFHSWKTELMAQFDQPQHHLKSILHHFFIILFFNLCTPVLIMNEKLCMFEWSKWINIYSHL